APPPETATPPAPAPARTTPAPATAAPPAYPVPTPDARPEGGSSESKVAPGVQPAQAVPETPVRARPLTRPSKDATPPDLE
ncbi:MAG: thioredoxin, partial [Candidatus Eremiobacterota bacterium]